MLTYECEYAKTHPGYVPFSIPDEEYDGQDAGSPAYVGRTHLALLGGGIGCWTLIAGGIMGIAGASAASTVAICGAAMLAGSASYLVLRELAERKNQ